MEQKPHPLCDTNNSNVCVCVCVCVCVRERERDGGERGGCYCVRM